MGGWWGGMLGVGERLPRVLGILICGGVKLESWGRLVWTSREYTDGLSSSLLPGFLYFLLLNSGTAVAQWLRCCATNWKIAGSIPSGVIGIFH